MLSNNPLTLTENHYTRRNTQLELKILYRNNFEKLKNNIQCLKNDAKRFRTVN